MSSGTTFPAFLKLEYQRDNRAGGSFLADIDDTLGQAERRFNRFSAEAQRQIDTALSTKRNSFGSLDLGTDQLRANAAAQEARALAARELAAATRLVAKEEGDLSQKTRLAIAALEAQAREEEGAARAARSHAAALEQVQERLNRHASATDAVTTSTRRGTDAYGAVTNSLRANRVAMVQAGQQMQDMAIQFQAGTRTSTILAQQLPQLAFAFSGMGGKVGTVARILSGPWSIALVAGSALLGGFIDALIETGDEADKAGGKTFDFSKQLDVLALSAQNTAAAMKQLESATGSAIQVQGDFLKQQADNAGKAVTDIEARIAEKNRKLADVRKNPDDYLLYGYLAENKLKDEIATDRQALASARAAKANADLAASQRIVLDSMDSSTAATNRYNIAVGELNRRRQRSIDDEIGAASDGTFITKTQYEREFQRLTKIKDAAIEAHKAVRGSGSGQIGREINLSAAKSIAQSAGLRVTSDYRTRAEQQWLYDNRRTPTNPVALPGTSAHERGNALDIGFAPGVTAASIKKAYAEEGVRLTKLLKEDGHFHIEWSSSGADKIEREAKQIDDFGQRAGDAIARITSQFDEQPKLIDQAAAATRDLDAIMADLEKRHPVGWEQMVKDAQAAKGVIQDALIRPFEELEGDSERRLKIQRLITAGRDDEADALQTIWRLESQLGPIDEARKQAVLDIVRHEREVSEVLESRRTIIDAYLDATRSVRGELEAILSGQGNIANFQRIFQQMRGRILTEQLFGPALRELEKYVKQNTFGPAVDSLETETKRAGSAIGSLADEVVRAKNQIANPGAAGAGGTSLETAFDAAFAKSGLAATTAANDNGEIVVTAPRGTVMAMTPEAYILQLSEAIVKPMLKGMEGVFGVQFSAGLGKALTGAFSGYVTGGPIGAGLGLLSSIPGLGGSTGIFGRGLEGLQQGSLISGLASSFGIGLDGTGSQIGGAIGSFIPGIGSGVGSLVGGLIGGKNTGRTVGGLAGAAIGSIIPGIGTILGGLVGSLIGGLFGTRPRGGGSVTNTGVTASANDGGVTSSLNSMGGNLQTAIQRIADAMGATVGSYGVGIGRYRDYYQVSSNPNDPRLGNSYFGRDSAASLYDGLDAEAAMRAAILGALQDGAIRGIREGAQRLLAAGNDLDKQIQKAVDFQSVFTRLRAYTDPVGAALDKLNTEFQHLKDVFAEAGASAAEYAQLEQLYGIERAKAIDAATKQITGSLRSLYDELTIGDSGLSLRDRKANAQAAYNPLAARVAAGDVTAYDDFATAARTLLDIERQISGSQSGYFDLFNQVRDLTRTTLDAATATANAATGVPSPFSNAANDNAAVVTGLAGLQSSLDAVNQNLGTLILQGGVGGTIDLNGIYASRSWY